MNIMLLTSEGFDTPNSINHLLITLSEDILKDNHRLHMVYSHKTGVYEDIPAQLKGYPGLKTSIIQRKNIDKNNFIRRYLDELKYVYSAYKVWRSHKKEIDVVVLQSNPCSVFHAVLLRTIMRKPIIFNLYDIFPGHAHDIGVIRSKLIYHALRLLQKPLYRASTYVVAMSEDMKQKLLQERIPESKIKVINNWFDDKVFKPVPRDQNKFMNKYNLDPHLFYVQFAGLLGYVFDYDMFIQTAKLLEDNSNIRFLLIGDGNLKNKILDTIKELNVENILYFPWQSLDIISDVYNACDVGFIPLKEGVIGNGIPSKACQLMAAQRTILNSVEESDYVRLFDENDMGVSITDRNPETAAKVILELYGNPNRMKAIGQNAAEYAYRHFSRSENTKRFIELICMSCNEKKKGKK